MTTPVAVRLHRVRYPLRTPHAAAHGVEVERDLILVEVEFADGVIGWGECSALARPTYTSEHTAGAWFVLRDELAPAAVEGRSFDVVGHPMALAAMRGAMLDASGRRRGQNLAGHFAARAGFPEPRAAVERCAVVGRRDVLDDLVAEVGELLEGRVDAVKLKVTPQPADLAAVAGVRTAWPDLRLAVDFNGTARRRGRSPATAWSTSSSPRPRATCSAAPRSRRRSIARSRWTSPSPPWRASTWRSASVRGGS